MKRLPYLLVYSRILFAALVVLLAATEAENYRWLIVVFMSVGLITDIFDGIIARKLGVSTEKLRVLDSNVDQFFWLVVIGSIFYLNWEFIAEYYWWILAVALLEALCYAVSYLRFGKPIATHSLLAKLWTLTLLAFLIDLVLHSQSGIIFYVCVILGIISRLEILAIILSLKKWTTDVPSIFAVARINRGEKVKKNSLFNS